MASTSTANTQTSTQSKKGFINELIFPYAIAIVAQLPMLLIYARDLWSRPHYRFAPFAVLATIAIAYSRWPRNEKQTYYKSTWSGILLIAGLVMGMAGYAFMTPWFTAFSVLLLLTSLLARTIDPETGKGLWTASLPLFVALVLPDNGDFRLITWLQRISAQLTSRLLDLLGMGHHLPGTIIQIPGKAYNIENACSGVQSFFTLLFVAVVFAVWNRRPWFRSSLLVLASVLWAIFMNTVRILMIPVVDRAFGVDLSEGVTHDLLGYSVLTIGILLLLSTDQFLLFLFGPVEESTGRAGPFGRSITAMWNNVIAGGSTEDGEKRRRKSRGLVSSFGRSAIWATAGILALVGTIQFVDVIRSYASPEQKIQFFASDVTQPFKETDMPATLVTDDDDGNKIEWERGKYTPFNRTWGSDLGLRSDSWFYTNLAKGIRTTLSFDQTFPGWHELTVCYQHDGWKLVRRQPKEGTIVEGENTTTWGYVEAEFEKETGEKAFLVFSHFDAFGNPLWVPESWGNLGSFLIRAKNRLSHRIRGSLFQSESYQTQVFTSQFGDISESAKDDIRKQYLVGRELMRQRFLEKRNGDNVTGDEPKEPATESKP